MNNEWSNRKMLLGYEAALLIGCPFSSNCRLLKFQLLLFQCIYVLLVVQAVATLVDL